MKRFTPNSLSKKYKLLLKADDSIILPISKPERDLSAKLDFWEQICLSAFRMMQNTNLQMIQCKILCRTYYTG